VANDEFLRKRLDVELSTLRGLLNKEFDDFLITYTDASKVTISRIDYYYKGVLVMTLTLTENSLTDRWVRT
jgi:hypothetical protein